MPTLRQPMTALPSDFVRIGASTEATAPGDLSAGDGSASFYFDASAGEWVIAGGNGSKLTFGSFTELLTISTAGFTDSSSTLPANAMVFAVSVRVVTAIPGASTFTVTNATSSRAYAAAAISTSAGTTDTGNFECPHPPQSLSAQAVRITPDAAPSAGTGQVRITAWWAVPTAPTS